MYIEIDDDIITAINAFFEERNWQLPETEAGYSDVVRDLIVIAIKEYKD